jgi:hypothetical protein
LDAVELFILEGYMILIIGAILVVSFCLFVCAYGLSRWVLLKSIDSQLAHTEQQLLALDASLRELSERVTGEKRGVQVS